MFKRILVPLDGSKLAEAAIEPAAQLVVALAASKHGRGGIGRWALGSKTERVLDASKVPLMIIRPKHVKAKLALKQGEAVRDEEMEVEKMIIAQEAWIEC